jgi:hypothetical protein
LSLPEVRRLLCRLVWAARQDPAFVLAWSLWRRAHQALAKACHYKKRTALQYLQL